VVNLFFHKDLCLGASWAEAQKNRSALMGLSLRQPLHQPLRQDFAAHLPPAGLPFCLSALVDASSIIAAY
jgi:hypothetical protein